MKWSDVILAKVKALPPFPGTVARLARIMNDPGAGAREVEEILMVDPSLTANVLKLANSGLFSRGREITSVRQAVAMLGIQRIFELVVAMAFSDRIPAQIPGYGLDATSFWRHSVAVAVMSDLVARRTGDVRGLYFTAGLLHDIGKLVIGTFLVRYAPELMDRLKEGGDIVSFEAETFEMDHAGVGRRILERWSLPEELQAAAGFHHRPLQAGGYTKIASVVHVADFLAHSWGFGEDVAELARRVEPGALEVLSLDEGDLENIGAQALDAIDEMVGAFMPQEEGR